MVRGNDRGDGGVVDDERDGQLSMSRQAGLVSQLREFSRRRACAGWGLLMSNARACWRAAEVGAETASLRHLPDSPAACERAVAKDAHAVPARGGQQRRLDAAHEDRVGGCSVTNRSRWRSRAVHLSLEIWLACVGGRADVADLALATRSVSAPEVSSTSVSRLGRCTW